MTEVAASQDGTELSVRRQRALAMGGPAAVERQRASGRLTARERVGLLVDPGSWHEIGLLADAEMRRDRPVAGDAVVTGFGRLRARNAGIIAIDSTVLAGTTAPVGMRKQQRLIDLALHAGIPLVMLCDADGGRIPDVMGWRASGLPLDFRTFLRADPARATVPRVTAVAGPCYGESALHAAGAHFTVMPRAASVALAGPGVVRTAIGEEVTHETLGGSEVAARSGLVHMIVEDEADVAAAIQAFLGYLPDTSRQPAPAAAPARPAVDPACLDAAIPQDSRTAYDVYDIIRAIADGRSILPWADDWGGALVTALTRIEGRPVGVIASQPLTGAGALDAAALDKEDAFLDLCDTFNIPVLVLQDVPGLMVGSQAERDGIVRSYERASVRLAQSQVPRIVVIMRKAYGGGHWALGARAMHPDFIYAWPSAEFGFMSADAGVETVYRRKLDEARAAGGSREAEVRAELRRDWVDESRPWEAAAHFYIDDVIEPRDTRAVVARSIEIAWGSRGGVA